MIAFCTTCKNRTQHLEQTLPQNLADNDGYSDCKFVILDYNSGDHLLDYLKTNHEQAIEAGRLVVYSFRENTPFRMAHAKNMAHRLGIIEGCDILVNLDADNYTGRGFASYVQQAIGHRQDLFLWARPIPGRLARGISGRIVISAETFLKTGGYDEKFDTWSPDDKDLNLRLRRLGYQPQEIVETYLDAVLHTDKMRFREYPHIRADAMAEERFESVALSESTVVNFGQIGCGTVFRNFAFDTPIDLPELPTRIFGIGMHKTATTSLHAALTFLGYDCGHWVSAHWAKAIWEEMHASGRSLTLEHHYALCDLPVTLLYELLDNAYPRSKFILTVREEGRWLESVRRHWSREHNPFRAAWDTDPFSHRVHKLLYGQKGFDAELFLAKYRAHNAEVLTYFAGRQKDLLVMEMDNGAGWRELCGFLGRPVPCIPYPKRFVKHAAGNVVR